MAELDLCITFAANMTTLHRLVTLSTLTKLCHIDVGICRFEQLERDFSSRSNGSFLFSGRLEGARG